MKKVLDFLRDVRMNNNRDWFETNRARYTEALAEFNGFTEKLIAAMPAVDPSVAGLTLKDCTYRIYRDTRFSHNKDPYKVHMGGYICPRGKKSGFAGYYFHVEPSEGCFLNGSLVAVGLYSPEPVVLKSVRDEIFDKGSEIVSAIKKAEGFTMDGNDKLSRVPKGYPADSPYADLLKLKDLSLYQPLAEELILSPGLLDRVVDEFRKTVEYNNLLNRAVAYARDEI